MAERGLTPDSHHDRLQEFAVRARYTGRRGLIDDAALTAIRALNDSGVDVLLLKGAALARILYGPQETRAYEDADLLVRPSTVDRARTVLAALGYRSVLELSGIRDVAGILHAEAWSRFEAGAGNVTIDLHWRLAGCDAADEAAFEVLFEGRQPLELAGQTVYTLDRAALALHLALHLAHHGTADIKAAADLQRGLERWRPETWASAAALARKLDGVESLAAGLALLPSGAALLGELGLGAPRDRLWEIANRGLRPRGTFHLEAFREAAGVRARLRLLGSALVPAKAWIESDYPWAARGRVRLGIAYVLHTLRAPAWALRASLWGRRARGRL